MMTRFVLAGGLLTILITATSSAFALDRSDTSGWRGRGISVLPDEPMGSGEPPAPPAPSPPPPPAADKPVAAPSPWESPLMTKPGLVVEFGTGASYLGGNAAQGAAIGAAFVNTNIKIGAYVNQHLGFFGGAEIGYGALWDGCVNDCQSAARYAFPITVEYATIDRLRGPYFEGGVVLAPTVFASSSDDSAPESLKVSAPMDARFGVGFRIPTKNAIAGRGALDIHGSFDMGQFSSFEYSNSDVATAGAIPADDKALHYAFALNLDWHFAL